MNQMGGIEGIGPKPIQGGAPSSAVSKVRGELDVEDLQDLAIFQGVADKAAANQKVDTPAQQRFSELDQAYRNPRQDFIELRRNSFFQTLDLTFIKEQREGELTKLSSEAQEFRSSQTELKRTIDSTTKKIEHLQNDIAKHAQEKNVAIKQQQVGLVNWNKNLVEAPKAKLDGLLKSPFFNIPILGKLFKALYTSLPSVKSTLSALKLQIETNQNSIALAGAKAEATIKNATEMTQKLTEKLKQLEVTLDIATKMVAGYEKALVKNEQEQQLLQHEVATLEHDIGILSGISMTFVDYQAEVTPLFEEAKMKSTAADVDDLRPQMMPEEDREDAKAPKAKKPAEASSEETPAAAPTEETPREQPAKEEGGVKKFQEVLYRDFVNPAFAHVNSIGTTQEKIERLSDLQNKLSSIQRFLDQYESQKDRPGMEQYYAGLGITNAGQAAECARGLQVIRGKVQDEQQKLIDTLPKAAEAKATPEAAAQKEIQNATTIASSKMTALYERFSAKFSGAPTDQKRLESYNEYISEFRQMLLSIHPDKFESYSETFKSEYGITSKAGAEALFKLVNPIYERAAEQRDAYGEQLQAAAAKAAAPQGKAQAAERIPLAPSSSPNSFDQKVEKFHVSLTRRDIEGMGSREIESKIDAVNDLIQELKDSQKLMEKFGTPGQASYYFEQRGIQSETDAKQYSASLERAIANAGQELAFLNNQKREQESF